MSMSMSMSPPKPHGFALAKAAYDARVAALRLQYRAATAHRRQLPRPLPPEQRYDLFWEREFSPPTPNGAVVKNGIVLSRREFKRMLHARCGYMPTLRDCLRRHDALPSAAANADATRPADRTDPGCDAEDDVAAVGRPQVEPALRPSATAADDMRTLFARDLTPDNPRLALLTYLWHMTATFVTEETAETKIDAFFRVTNPSPYGLRYVNAAQRIAAVMAVGSTARLDNRVEFDETDFATTDRHLTVGRDAEVAELEMGCVVHQMMTREAVVKDAADGTILGMPGVAHILDISCSAADAAKNPVLKTNSAIQ